MPFFLSHSMLNLIDTAFSLQYIHPAVYNRWTGLTGLEYLDWTLGLEIRGSSPCDWSDIIRMHKRYAKRSHVFGSL